MVVNKKISTAVPLVFSIAILFLMYQKIIPKLVNDWWTDPNYSHGFLIPLISLYLVYQKRIELSSTSVSPSISGVLLILIASLMYVFGQIAGELFTQRLSLIVILVGITLCFGGVQYWKLLWIPILYLIFMIPLPYIVYDSIAFPLKLLATKISTSILHLLKVPIYSEGNILYLPNTTLEVVDACSGIRSLMSIIALSVIISLYTQRTLIRCLILILLSIPIVVFCNILRVTITGLLAILNPKLATGFFHSFAGEAIFLLGVVMVFLVGIMMRTEKENFPVISKRGQSAKQTRDLYKRSLIVPWLVPVLLLLVFIISSFTIRIRSVPLKMPLLRFPEVIDGFTKTQDEFLNEKILKNLGVDNYLMRVYRSQDGYPITLYIGFYEDQKEGAMIHSPKHCYPGSGWNPASSEVITLNIPKVNTNITINEYFLTKGDEKQLVYYWYQSRGRTVANEYKDRLLMVWDSLLKHRSDGALVRISGPAQDIEKAKKIQKNFIEKVYPVLIKFLPS